MNCSHWSFGLPMVFGCRLQNQVDEVVDVMQNNIGRVMERGERLEDLRDKSGKWRSTDSFTSLTFSLCLSVILARMALGAIVE